MDYKKKILFICTANACRSPMAEGILQYLASDRFDVFSAGIMSSRVHPLSIKVLTEWEIDISSQSSDNVEDYLNYNIDIVITLCDKAKNVCPPFPGNVEHIFWDVPDPFPGWTEDPQFLMKFREVRNIINSHIKKFLISY